MNKNALGILIIIIGLALITATLFIWLWPINRIFALSTLGLILIFIGATVWGWEDK